MHCVTRAVRLQPHVGASRGSEMLIVVATCPVGLLTFPALSADNLVALRMFARLHPDSGRNLFIQVLHLSRVYRIQQA